MTESLESVRLFIATPCYGGQISVAYFKSMLATTDYLRKHGIQHHVMTKSNESLISRARNTLVAEFMGRTMYTHLLWIDADTGWDPEIVIKLLRFDQPVTGVACPMKNIDWERVRKMAGKAQTGKQLRDLSMLFNINHCHKPDARHIVDDGFIEVAAIGTGFMLIRRDVFDIMRSKLPDSTYVNDIAGYENVFTNNKFYTFFDTMLHPKTRRYLSEDFAFCYRWRELCGGKIYANIKYPLTHYGNYPFSGSYLGSQS